MDKPSLPEYLVGGRYFHAKTRRPVTLRYIGHLPPSPPPLDPPSQVWLGIEYDDPSFGKHSGVYQGIQVFHTREEGSGAFLKFAGRPLQEGKNLVQSIEERYGPIIPIDLGQSSQISDNVHPNSKELILGSSKGSILVETPNNWANARKRLGNLEKLRIMGFEDEGITELGGENNHRDIMRTRLRGVEWLNLSRNLLKGWEEVAQIVGCFERLQTLTVSHSRFEALLNNLPDDTRQRLGTLSKIRELHLSDCSTTMKEVVFLIPFLPNLRVLHLEANRTISTLSLDDEEYQILDRWKTLKELSLGGCRINRWDEVAVILKHLSGLESLDLSFTPLSHVSPPSITIYENIRSLSLLGSCLLRWEYIDHISQYFPELTSLRFSLSSDAISSITTNGTQNSPTVISASTDLQRALIISKFPNLITFNSTTIAPSERRDAELFYINHVKSRISEHPNERESWGRYVELCKVYGRDETLTRKKPEAGLKRKMITLRVFKHPTDPSPGTLALLPSSSIKLLQQRVSRLVGATAAASLHLWTVIEEGGELEKVIDISKEREGNDWTVGWWFEDGDCVLVDGS
ncbi:hypothetical protein C345_02635 [Cryptococcus neoformans A2-102-5]|nr:hypothetical protein C346_02765 [Cryptococcus neoformans var. grubii D17-1]OXG96548.1 hypothetical protein C345_02635 [Cryptococcus neoformans var. grubii A2-102-5]